MYAVRLAVFGHLAWTAQHASGNRGDDFRALKLAELQPYFMQHPTHDMKIFTVLGLQGEEKAGKRGMRTVVNPSYSAFIANKNAEMCPLGAFAFYQHYLHDEKEITKTSNVDWLRNSSWRGIRVLHGPKSAAAPYNEQNLYNLYCHAYKEQRVEGSDTAKLGWKRGQTYFDTYAPALPKKASQAILGGAGYKATELYEPIWQKVLVPPQFLLLVCPMAEEIRETIKGASGRANLSGADQYWDMIIKLRPYLFQCGAAIFQKCPKSAIFRLSAFSDPDVVNWMKSTFPSDLALLKAHEGSPADLTQIQNVILQRALENMYGALSAQEKTIPQRFSSPPPTSTAAPSTPQVVVHFDENMAETGTYHIPGVENGSSPIRAFVNSSPRSPNAPRSPTQVDLVLPHAQAFYASGAPAGIVPPLFGQKSVRWPDVFALVRQPKMCWGVWGPSKTVDKFNDVNEFWTTYVDGEFVYNDAGVQTGKKPPMRLVEQHFQAAGRTPDAATERAAIAVGVDISIRIRAVIAALQYANIYHPGVAGQTLALQKIFYQLCNFSSAPVTLVFVFDGPGRPSMKRGTTVVHHPLWLIDHLKTMIKAFWYHFYDAPGEAEAELAHLNASGRIDAVITEDSDAFLASPQDSSLMYAIDSLENTDTVSLDRAGLVLCALLLGGDYAAGILGIGSHIARELAAHGFGTELVKILKSTQGSEQVKCLAGPEGYSFKGFLDNLGRTFRDHNVRQTAYIRLTTTRQGKTALADFIQAFELNAEEAGYDPHDDLHGHHNQFLCENLENLVNEEVRTQLYAGGVEIPEDYAGMKARMMTISRILERQKLRKAQQPKAAGTPFWVPAKPPPPAPSGNYRGTAPNLAKKLGPGEVAPMDVDASKSEGKPFKCYKCGDEGHMARECPQPRRERGKINARALRTNEMSKEDFKFLFDQARAMYGQDF
ncbi:hypothetical protein C8R46DRAFT_1210130 [Mycena filopes]|nr:hypothetical protein C8R46DRAFT_1210130 [Mycena filopes]